MDTSLWKKMRSAGPESEYDANAKALLGEKIILAHILSGCVAEFMGRKPEELVSFIEGEPEIGIRPVDPGESNSPHVKSVNSEDIVPYEGTVNYDLRFYVRMPDGNGTAGIIIDLEAQRSFRPGYDLVTRGIYYSARMLSSQMGIEFTGTNYNNIKKVYSIWICMQVPEKMENTITEIKLEQNNVLGSQQEIGRYDLMRTVFIGLSKEPAEKKDEYYLHRLLETLFSPNLSMERRGEILAGEYQIPLTQDAERRMRFMSNLGEGIREEALEEGMEQGVERMGMLNKMLIKEKKYKELERASTDKKYMYKLFEKYGI